MWYLENMPSFAREQMLLGHSKSFTDVIVAFIFKNTAHLSVDTETFWRHKPTLGMAINKKTHAIHGLCHTAVRNPCLDHFQMPLLESWEARVNRNLRSRPNFATYCMNWRGLSPLIVSSLVGTTGTISAFYNFCEYQSHLGIHVRYLVQTLKISKLQI